MNYKEYLKSDRWQKLRKLCLEYYEYRCLNCNEKATEVHHKTYRNLYTRKELYDLKPLCRSCHKEEHINC